MCAEWLHQRQASPSISVRGWSPTGGNHPGAAFVQPGASLIMGALAGLVCYGGILLKAKLKYDDSLDAFGVHGIGGTFAPWRPGCSRPSALPACSPATLTSSSPR